MCFLISVKQNEKKLAVAKTQNAVCPLVWGDIVSQNEQLSFMICFICILYFFKYFTEFVLFLSIDQPIIGLDMWEVRKNFLSFGYNNFSYVVFGKISKY